MSNETLQEFAEQFQYCAVCMSTEGLHIHHLVGGAGRRHERYNLIRLCHTCHHKVHSVSGEKGLSHGSVLNAKRLCDDSFFRLGPWLLCATGKLSRMFLSLYRLGLRTGEKAVSILLGGK